MMERILSDVQHACPEMSVTLLRYFNPIGAHESGFKLFFCTSRICITCCNISRTTFFYRIINFYMIYLFKCFYKIKDTKVKKLWKEISIFGIVIVVFLGLFIYRKITHVEFTTITQNALVEMFML